MNETANHPLCFKCDDCAEHMAGQAATDSKTTFTYPSGANTAERDAVLQHRGV